MTSRTTHSAHEASRDANSRGLMPSPRPEPAEGRKKSKTSAALDHLLERLADMVEYRDALLDEHAETARQVEHVGWELFKLTPRFDESPDRCRVSDDEDDDDPQKKKKLEDELDRLNARMAELNRNLSRTRTLFDEHLVLLWQYLKEKKKNTPQDPRPQEDDEALVGSTSGGCLGSRGSRIQYITELLTQCSVPELRQLSQTLDEIIISRGSQGQVRSRSRESDGRGSIPPGITMWI